VETTITAPLGVAHAVCARLLSLGVKFTYEYKFGNDHITVAMDNVLYVQKLINTLMEIT
jgi:hypothetical protein